MPTRRVGILFGGRSTEHEVSVNSATTIFNALDPARYTPVLVGLDHDGTWRVAESDVALTPQTVFPSSAAPQVTPLLRRDWGLDFVTRDGRSALAAPLDCVFPIIHGRGGEDGSLQGLLEVAEIPYVGPSVLASALCMDKTATKRVLRDAGIPVVPSLESPRSALLKSADPLVRSVESAFAYPVFVKPAKTGSSVGVHKARNRGELEQAIRDATRFDLDVLVEQGLSAREIECAVLGGHEPQASCLGEIIPDSEFYDYEAKYGSDRTQLVIPAVLDEAVAQQVRRLAVDAFRVLKCWGLSRVDFFVERDTNKVYLNELNTLPGFTRVSMYPMLWEKTGVPLPELVHRLIELAFERHREQAALEIRYRA